MSPTASHRFDADEANTIGVTHSAQMSMAPLRALLTLQPRFRKRPAIQPPPMLPTSAIR